MDGFADESGLFGVAGHRAAAQQVQLGLHALQHRGGTGVGVVCSDGHLLRARHGRGPAHGLADLSDLRGATAVGQVFAGPAVQDERPLLARYRGGQVALAMAGRFSNGARLRRELKEQGALFTTLTEAEVLLQLVASSGQRTLVNRIVDALWKVDGAFSLLVLTEDRLVAVRDPRGFRPLVLGRVDGATVFASEDTAIRFLGGEVLREVDAGEMVIVDADGVRSVTPFFGRAGARCAQEILTVARSDARAFGAPVHAARFALGERLGRDQPVAGGQVVVALPGSAPAAIGFARSTRLPYQEGLLAADPGRLVEPPAGIPDFAARARFVAVPSAVSGARVVLVAAALGSGDDIRPAARALRGAGAASVHLRVASPAVRGACPYGVSSPSDEELAVQRGAADVAGWLGVDTLGALTAEAVHEVLAMHTGGQRGGTCDACLTRDWPIPAEEPEDQLPLFGG